MDKQRATAPSRGLPFDVNYDYEGVLGGLARDGYPPVPPLYVDLESEGLIAPVNDPDRWFSPDEARTAAWLRARGCPVLSVKRLEGRYRRTPDAVSSLVAITIETKTAYSSRNAIAQRIREGRKQARHVIIDLRSGACGIDEATAGLDLALGRYGQHLDEIVLVLADDLAIGWFHG